MQYETMLDRFLKIKNYGDVEEVEAFLKSEHEILGGDLPKLYNDMLAMSLLSDRYYTNVPEDIQEAIIKRNNGIRPELLVIIDSYRVAEARMTAIANWGDISQELPEADVARRYIWSLIEDHHSKGYDIFLSTVTMENGEPEAYSELKASGDNMDVDAFEVDYLGILTEVFDNINEEYSLQLFFQEPGKATTKAFILVNCLWTEDQDGYGECTPGPFIVSGTGEGGIKLIAPDNIGLPVLSEKGVSLPC